MAAASALAVLTVLSGCGSSGDPVARAAKETAAERTARVVVSLSTRRGPLAESTSYGVVDFDRSRTRTHQPALGFHGTESNEITDGRVFYVERSKGHWSRVDARKRLGRVYGPERKGSYDLFAALERRDRSAHRLGGGGSLTHYRKAIGPKATPVDVWVDHDGLIRRVRAGTSTDLGLGTIYTTIRFTDFGTPVHITLPPPSRVTRTTIGGK